MKRQPTTDPGRASADGSQSPARLETVPDSSSSQWWRALEEGRVLVQQCLACGRSFFYPRPLCPHCHATELEWRDIAGGGTIHAATVVHQPTPIFAGDDPYPVALVDLDEGARMLLRVDEAPAGRPLIGSRVQIATVETAHGPHPRAVYAPDQIGADQQTAPEAQQP